MCPLILKRAKDASSVTGERFFPILVDRTNWCVVDTKKEIIIKENVSFNEAYSYTEALNAFGRVYDKVTLIKTITLTFEK